MTRNNVSWPLPDGGQLVLYDVVGPGVDPPGVDPSRNLHRLDADGRIVWTIQPSKHIQGGDRMSTYVGIDGDADELRVYAFDGCVYRVDLCNGSVTFLEWEK
jgi:hypothetical protein